MRYWNKEMRMRSLFNGDKTVMVALDHGQGGVKPGLEHPEKLLNTLIDANPDAVLLSGGMARRFNYLFGGKNKPSLVISTDFILHGTIPQIEGQGEEIHQSISVEECVRLGADAIKALLIFGRRDAKIVAENMAYITRLAEECNYWNLPLIVEPTTWGELLTDEMKEDVNLYSHMARISAELGADLVKIDFVGSGEQFKEVLDNCPVPVAILGGSKASAEDIANTISEANKCGVCGVVFGRNVWQSSDPAKMIEALKAITYDDDEEKYFRIIREIN